MAELSGANCSRSRIFSPIAVPPGSRVTNSGTPAVVRRAASRRTWVDFPQPSEPSKVMNGRRGMRAIVKQVGAIVDHAMFMLSKRLEMKKYWLVKQEPEAYSWSDLVSDSLTSWTGVRNFQARNNLRAMQKGDAVLFYHSVSEKAVVGIAEVAREAYRDPTAKEGDWSAVDLKPVKGLE